MSKNKYTEYTQERTVKARYALLDGRRQGVLAIARECSALTIPTLLPPEGHVQGQELPTPFQSVGARGVNNLAAKLLLTLFPPNTPFLKLTVDDFTLEELMQDPEARAHVEEAFNKIERAVATSVETMALRVPAFEALKHLIVTGNVLVYIPDEGGMQVYRLDHYVVKRDPLGNVIEIITKEEIHPVALPDSIREQVKAKMDDPESTVEVYTHIKRDSKLWTVKQEVEGEIVPDSEGTYSLKACPWIVLRWTAVTGEDYGRGFVEEYLGDLRSLEALREAIVEGSAAAAKVLYLVDPTGTTRIQKVAKAKSGDVINGNAKDITVLQLEKYADFQVAKATADGIEQNLAQAFLLLSGIQRDAERVTAEEIRSMVKELEDSLGGVYSVLSQELQLPIANRIMHLLSKRGTLPKLPDKVVQPMIVTGLEALGRGHDLTKLLAFKSQVESSPELMSWINCGDLVRRIGTALGIPLGGLVKTEEQYEAEQMAAQQAALSQQMLPGMMQEMTKGVMTATAEPPRQE